VHKQCNKKIQHPLVFEGQVTKHLSCKYLLFLPQNYDNSSESWPTILFLHGAGQRGEDPEAVKKHGPPEIVEKKPDLPFIVISPQCPEGQWWNHDIIMALLEEVITHYRIDEDRIYLTGLSMGGFATWSLATEYPHRFAAITPVCGGGYPYTAHQLKRIPVWAFHGAKDPIVPLYESERMVEAVKQAGGKVKFTVFPEVEHNAWDQAYNDPTLYEWFLQHRRSDREIIKS